MLTGKLEVRHDTWAYDWLAAQSKTRADYVCAADLDAFTRSARPAVTKQGLIKGGGGRHEKNDTSRIDDRSSWVLGWTNQAKLDALLAKATQLTKESAAITGRTREITLQQKKRASVGEALTLLGTVSSYTDRHASVAELEQVEQQKKDLVAEVGSTSSPRNSPARTPRSSAAEQLSVPAARSSAASATNTAK
ncbi:hypothetical protein ACIQGZ_03060 [Streptomyces sp. NPDC092296]|uniref:hypothetical protein n=1 Tax=Streptomyces sp. NPDC092296 TaxID=3366012 RepID=UPI00381F540E